MLDDLDDASLDALPHGVVCVSSSGTVLRINRTECERAGIQRWRALGRDFFRDVGFVLQRQAAAGAVTVELAPSGTPDRVYLCIYRSDEPAARSSSSTLARAESRLSITHSSRE